MRVGIWSLHLRMKLIAITTIVVSVFVSTFSSRLGIYFVAAFSVAFAGYGFFARSSQGLNPLNDLPNALRVFFAAAGGYLLTTARNFLVASAALALIFLSIYLNDEYQRNVVAAVREGRRGGSVALLGIDGSGKSSHAKALESWFQSKGYRARLLPFHRYLFIERLPTSRKRGKPSGRRVSGNPIRPLLSLFDNLLLHVLTAFGCELEGKVIIYDRFIWSTYVKYHALGYPVQALSAFYLFPRPRYAVVFDIPVAKSLKTIEARTEHIRYGKDVLSCEREAYIGLAKERGYPVIDSSADFESVQTQLEQRLERIFPLQRKSEV